MFQVRTTKGYLYVKVEIFALCDAATSHAGKLNLLGVFDAIYAREVPAIHPNCSIAIRLRWDRIEENAEHRIRVQFVDEDGHEVVPGVDGTIHIQSHPDRRTSTTDVTLNLQRLQLPNYGHYAVDLAVDGRHEASIPLYVLPQPHKS